MNTVHVFVYAGGVCITRYETEDVNRAIESFNEAQRNGWTTKFWGPFGYRFFEPPIESVISQLPDDSQARHDRNRARWKSP